MATIETSNTTHQHASPSTGDTVVFTRSARHLYFTVSAGGSAEVSLDGYGGDFLILPEGFHGMQFAHVKTVVVGTVSGTLNILGISL